MNRFLGFIAFIEYLKTFLEIRINQIKKNENWIQSQYQSINLFNSQMIFKDIQWIFNELTENFAEYLVQIMGKLVIFHSGFNLFIKNKISRLIWIPELLIDKILFACFRSKTFFSLNFFFDLFILCFYYIWLREEP